MPEKKFITLGIEYGGHDTSASLLVNGQVVAACEQERFDLVKHSRAFPTEAIKECLKISGLKNISSVDEIAYSGDYLDMINKVYLRPAMRDPRRIEFLLDDAERIRGYLSFEKTIREKLGYRGKISFFRHHLCHLASAYFPSGFNDALLVSYDGMGEIETSMIGVGNRGQIKIVDDKNWYPHSLGLLYSAVTFFLGWQHHCDEGIIMGLASYGNPNEIVEGQSKSYIEIFREILKVTGHLSFEVDVSWIEYQNQRDTWVSEKFINVFGKKRSSCDTVNQKHKNIAAALQLRIEEVVLDQLAYLREKTGHNKICIAGGVGLNCSLNGKIIQSKIFEEIFVQPASGDAGVSLGAAFLASRRELGNAVIPRRNHEYSLGSRYEETEIEKSLMTMNVNYRRPDNICRQIAEFLADGKIVGWFQGATEFGPRALGNRSILSRPFPAEQRDYINTRVKNREEFRPFAASVMEEHANTFFEIDQPSPHMLIACKTIPKKRDAIPAVIHFDGTCRIQTVCRQSDVKFYDLLYEFYKKTGIPLILNTSFNVKGQPVVNTPTQAIETFLNTNIDVLAIGPFLLEKMDH